MYMYMYMYIYIMSTYIMQLYSLQNSILMGEDKYQKGCWMLNEAIFPHRHRHDIYIMQQDQKNAGTDNSDNAGFSEENINHKLTT